jgi:hypothetical protein
VNNCAISWSSRKQCAVATSSCEAEYYATSDCAKDILWTRNLLEELKFPQATPSVLMCDNKSTIRASINDVAHSLLKHVALKHHFIKEQVENNIITLEWVPTALQQADILTKPLGPLIYTRLRNKLMGGHGN